MKATLMSVQLHARNTILKEDLELAIEKEMRSYAPNDKDFQAHVVIPNHLLFNGDTLPEEAPQDRPWPDDVWGQVITIEAVYPNDFTEPMINIVNKVLQGSFGVDAMRFDVKLVAAYDLKRQDI